MKRRGWRLRLAFGGHAAHDLDMPLASNRILGEKYRLVRPLDETGMGSVWLAEHLSLAAPVAVKLVTSVAMTASRPRRFMREARAAAAARSPHVVQMIDYGVDDGTPYIVMELLEGESLAARLQRLGRLGPNETEGLIRQVSRAVARAHDGGIVHRDLKPSNIFIACNEDEELVKLLDFGISKAAGEEAGPDHPTRTTSLLGAPCYMSPEQLEGSRLCDHRADIWALGVIAFECLVGRLPFAGKGIGGLVQSVCSDPVPVPSEHGSVPAGFDAWFARACARNLNQRFETVRDAARELRRLVASGSSAAPGSGAPDREGSGVPRPEPIILPEPTIPRVPPGARTPPSGRYSGALPPSTAPPSSTTLDHGLERRPLRSVWLVAPLLSSLAIVLMVRGLQRTPDTARVAEVLPPAAAPAAPSSVPALALPAEAPPLTASIVASGEGADMRLSIDGDALGHLPQEVHGLTPGEHSVMISAGPRYVPYEARLTLAPGQVLDLGTIELVVAKGLATVVAGRGAAGAMVMLKLGSKELRLPALPVKLEVDTSEPYTLVARRKGYESYEEPLTFGPGQAEKTFSVALERASRKPAAREAKPASTRRARSRSAPPRAQEERPRAAGTTSAPASFTFRATPEASVLLDGMPMGTTPLLDVPVSPGSHRVLFIHGEQRKALVVTAASGKKRSVSARFLAPGGNQ